MSKKSVNSLEFALDFEAKGAIMYLDLAKRTENILGKKLFYSLAAEEVAHAQKIDDIYARLKTEKGLVLPVSPGIQSIEKQIRDFFESSNKLDFSNGASDIKGYELAMDMERKGYKVYSDFIRDAQNETEKVFFQALLIEEKMHLEALANVYKYLTNTGDWLQEEESKVWNWMNF